MTRRCALLFALLALGPLGCASAPPRRPPGLLTVRGPAPEALVFVDDALAGKVADLARSPAPLVPGFHRVEVRAEGMLPAYREVTLASGQSATLDVPLRPDLDGDKR